MAREGGVPDTTALLLHPGALASLGGLHQETGQEEWMTAGQGGTKEAGRGTAWEGSAGVMG